MKPEAQRIAIAEACGTLKAGKPKYEHRYGPGPMKVIGRGPPISPDYLSDLNAMHEAEKYLFHPHSEFGARLFEQNLARILFAKKDINDIGDCAGEIAAIAHATASQRAEAFLRTLNLWKD